MRSQIKEKKNNSGTETNRTLRYLVSFLVIMGLLVSSVFLEYRCRKCGNVFFRLSGRADKASAGFHTVSDCLENPSAPYHCCSSARRGTFRIRFPAAEFFPESDCRTVCAWDFLRSQTCRGTDHDLSSGKRDYGQFPWNGGSCICRFTACHGICPSDFVSGIEYVASCSVRYPDWLYLFGDYGFLCDVCGRFQYCQSSQLVNGKFFRYELGAHSHHGHDCRNHGCDYLRACKTNQCLSDGRILCTEIWA